MENIVAVVQPDKLREQIAELNEKAAAPDLWDDPSAAQAVTSALSHRQSELDRITQMSERIDDLEAMVDMAAEDPDEGADILAEAEADLEKLRKDLGDLEIRTLLDGEYDERNAVITIRSGAGGVGRPDALLRAPAVSDGQGPAHRVRVRQPPVRLRWRHRRLHQRRHPLAQERAEGRSGLSRARAHHPAPASSIHERGRGRACVQAPPGGGLSATPPVFRVSQPGRDTIVT